MSLTQLRSKIDRIDTDILDLLVQRFAVVAKIGAYKKTHVLPILDASRWDAILASLTSLAQQKGLSKKFVADLWNIIHKESLRLQKKSA